MSSNPSVTRTGIAVVNNDASIQVFYQLLDGYTAESATGDNKWTQQELAFSPAHASLLASISWNSGAQASDPLHSSATQPDQCVNRFACTILITGLKANPGAGIAAVTWLDSSGGVHIRVYCQREDGNFIAENEYEPSTKAWSTNILLSSNDLGCTSLAALAYFFNGGLQLRVYYRTAGISLADYCWSDSDFKTGQVTAKTPISAVVFGNVVLQVFWRDRSGNTVFSKDTGSWGSPTTIGAIPASYEFAVAQWGDGVQLRIYYQDFAASCVNFALTTVPRAGSPVP